MTSHLEKGMRLCTEFHDPGKQRTGIYAFMNHINVLYVCACMYARAYMCMCLSTFGHTNSQWGWETEKEKENTGR